ncbi:MAG: glutamine--tRNA ligase/YqeY domain fusion protein [Candidatus Margulisiibacteriota bacterium]
MNTMLPEASHFIDEIVREDLESGVCKVVHTRFPPEPNGCLHIGHAKSVGLNFGIAKKYQGKCNLRFDDTNPSREDSVYVNAIMEDVRWLGFEWDGEPCYSSDYFDKLYEYALCLIDAGKAYVCDLNAEQMRQHRGTLTEPGVNSPFRGRTVAQNRELFMRMSQGEFDEGSKTLRAKIEMASPNMNMRDPVIYRIMKVEHHRTGGRWCIYPMYDFAHGITDALEGITHSICTLEFEDHRPLYDWFLDQLSVPCHPKQIEFARLNMTRTVMSKRKLLELVASKIVNGWDDPRLPTIAGMRRRGYPPSAIRAFVERIGVAKMNSIVDFELLEHCVREDLNIQALRVMAVLRPLKVIITNYPEGQVEWFEAENNPEDPSAGKRTIPFSREIYIEQDDFMEVPPPKYFRLSPGREIRLKHAYYVTATQVIKDEAGQIKEVHCTYDPQSRGGWTNDGRKVLGTSHWVSASYAISAQIRWYEPLYCPSASDHKEDIMNDQSLCVIDTARVEPSLADAIPGTRYQFLRQGYFCADTDSLPEKPVFNLTVTLRDSWAKDSKKKP